MAMIRTEFSCPKCKKITGELNRIHADAGELRCSKEPGHIWKDTITFFDDGPSIDFKPEIPENLPQESHTPLTVSVPIALKDHLEQSYGKKLQATVVAVLSQMSPNTMTIAETDLQRLRDHLGKMPVNSSELVGLIYAKVCEATDAREERNEAVKDLKAYEDRSPGRIILDLGDQYQTAQQLAKDADMPLKMWAEQRFKNAVESNWF
jgi:hypothetical protein